MLKRCWAVSKGRDILYCSFARPAWMNCILYRIYGSYLCSEHNSIIETPYKSQ